jgi:ATP diphosphatase
MSDSSPDAAAIDRLIEIMARLRAPDGCAWDREQTPATLKPQMLEECYEVMEAIDSGSLEHLTEKPERKSALEGVPRALPALMRADAIQRKARHVGFDWPDVRGALAKVREEMAEVTAEIEADMTFAQANEAIYVTSAETAEEIGDLLFSIVNLTRHLKLGAEDLLTGATDKFVRRFREVEERVKAQGKTLQDCTLEELDALWNAVKAGSDN